jgi:hypothetical protein
MAEDDNFDIDIYGDEAGQDGYSGEQEAEAKYENKNYDSADAEETHTAVEAAEENTYDNNQYDDTNGQGGEAAMGGAEDVKAEETEDTRSNAVQASDSTPAPPSRKRKGSMDERPVDLNATNAILLNELHWWITEDEVRGWCNRSGVEGELKDLTFNEHKVNGKSKG